MENQKKIVAYFDFDGTISNVDTLIPFLIYAIGKLRFILCLPQLSWIAILYWLKIITNEVSKERTLIRLIKGRSVNFLEDRAKNFALTKLNKYIKPAVYAKLEWHREHGHVLILVSANLAVYLRYWAILHKLDYVIATEIEIKNDYATGKLATRNCYGKEKVSRIDEFLSQHSLSFSYSYAYGNSRGDTELLAYVNEPFYVCGESIERTYG